MYVTCIAADPSPNVAVNAMRSERVVPVGDLEIEAAVAPADRDPWQPDRPPRERLARDRLRQSIACVRTGTTKSVWTPSSHPEVDALLPAASVAVDQMRGGTNAPSP
jgi:hypothetical protein